MSGSIFVLFLLGYLAICGFIYVVQDSLIFHPSNNLSGPQGTPDSINLNYEDVYLTSTQDRKIHGWLVPHSEPIATVLFLHGNAGNISHRLDTLRIFHELSLSTFIIDYQGYGLSEGKPSEENCYDDALAAWNYLRQDNNLEVDDIIVFGRSMGGGVASWLASKHSPQLLILESAFESIVKMGQKRYPFLPISILTRTHFDTASRIQQIQTPVVFIHSTQDEIVPYSHSKNLYQITSEPKHFFNLTGSHNTGFLENELNYKSIFLTLINQYF